MDLGSLMNTFNGISGHVRTLKYKRWKVNAFFCAINISTEGYQLKVPGSIAFTNVNP